MLCDNPKLPYINLRNIDSSLDVSLIKGRLKKVFSEAFSELCSESWEFSVDHRALFELSKLQSSCVVKSFFYEVPRQMSNMLDAQ